MKTTYRRNEKIRFINPYTFVPIQRKDIGKSIDIDRHYHRDGLHTGYMKCSIYVKTPLAIPDTDAVPDAEEEKQDTGEKKKDGHKAYPFFSYGEGSARKLAIPGSSIRGELRSVFEAATDSCMSTLRPDTKLSRRVDYRHAYNPGILKREDDGWHLYRAERYILASKRVEVEKGAGYRECQEFSRLSQDAYIKVKTDEKGRRYIVTASGTELRWGDLVSFSVHKDQSGINVTHHSGGYPIWAGIAEHVSKIEGKDSRSLREETGYVYVGEMFAMKKHGESIFQCKKEVENISTEELERAFRDLLETLEIYQDTGINKTKGHSGYKAFEDVMSMQAIPLWYKPDKGRISLSLASIGRAMYETSLNELVGSKAPCEKKQHLCEACALFGMAAQEEKFGSRIRFTDALAIGKCETQMATISVLGQPRYSYLPFYEKNNTGSYDNPEAEISGRKFYWHNLRAATDGSIYKMTEKNQFNSTMELVLPESEKPLFEFTVYYDGITEEQLDRLIWCINFGDNKVEGKMAHKIGHGKPLGLGSVKFLITEHKERVFTNNQYKWKERNVLPAIKNLNMKNHKIIMKIMNTEEPIKSQNESTPGMEIPIEYPDIRDENGERLPEKREDNEDARHNWYSQNKRDREVMTLPLPLMRNQALYVYQKEPQARAKTEWKKGQLYQAVVTGFNLKKTTAYIKVEDNTKGGIYFKDVRGAEYGKIDTLLHIGQRINVTFKEQRDGHVNFYLADQEF